MSGARRIARELAVIILPQLPKNREKLEKLEIEDLVGRAVHTFVDHARELIESASSELSGAAAELNAAEALDPKNTMKLENLRTINLTSAQIRVQLERIDRAVTFLSEAIDLPELTLHAGRTRIDVPCSKCKHVGTVILDRNDRSEVRSFLIELVEMYYDHREQIDAFIRTVKSKWKVERMVSIDRDILRLACTEAFFMSEVPIKVAFSEAVELCHRFADDKAAKFVNGLLADLAEEAEYFRETGELRLMADTVVEG